MSTEIVPFEVGGVRVAEMGYSEWTDEQIELVANTIAKGANQNEFKLFREVCQRMRLNPFAQAQIWFVKRRVRDETKPGGWGDAFSIQVGIDGLRLLAERTGLYEGRIGPEWARAPKTDADSFVWRTAWMWDEPPAVARVGVWKRGARQATWAVATWRESAQWAKGKDGKPYLMGLWASKPAFMLGKVAEAQALRAAFPAELAGIEYRPDIELRRRGGMRIITEDGPAQLYAPEPFDPDHDDDLPFEREPSSEPMPQADAIAATAKRANFDAFVKSRNLSLRDACTLLSIASTQTAIGEALEQSGLPALKDRLDAALAERSEGQVAMPDMPEPAREPMHDAAGAH